MLARLVILVAATVLASSAAAQTRGFRLFQPTGNEVTKMVDEQGAIVHSWPGTLSIISHMLPDGTLLRGASTGSLMIGGATGRLQRMTFDGTLIWDYQLDGPDLYLHHDIEPMPNGNVLCIAWVGETVANAIAAGRDPAMVTGTAWLPDAIIEIQPTGPTTGAIVWEWHMMDHVIQDFDPTKANYGAVDQHPELLDINFPDEVIGNGDWNHFNGIDYDPINDWIIVSARQQSEIYLIDHSTTTAEAAGHTGGARGKGGDFLYRWGNPEAYRAGGPAERTLFFQHDPRFVPPGHPGAGHLTLFNNDYMLGIQSAAYEIELPLDPAGNPILDPVSGRYGPTGPTWMWTAPFFYSRFVSSVERQENGNTLILGGVQNLLLEVDPAGQVVWSYNIVTSGLTFQCHLVDRSLWADAATVPVGGGQVDFDHLTGSAHDDQIFLLLGSISGTSPGFHILGGVTMPLQFDYLTSAMLSQFNSGPFSHTIGRLDSNGQGSSALVIPPGFIPPGLAGLNMDFAHVIFDSSMLGVRASNPVRVTIVP